MIGNKTIEIVGGKLKSDLIKELREQGHTLTGSLENSVQSSITKSGDSLFLDVEANDYLGGSEGHNSGPLNTGVPADRIPYDSSVKTGAKTSRYIQALANYAKLRFGISDDKEALSAAFAIAKKHEKEGMPTQGSYAHSKNGRRIEAMEKTLENNNSKYDQEFEKGLLNELDVLFDDVF